MIDEVEKVLDVAKVEEDKTLQKPKKKLTEKQKDIGRANLAKGRETLALKRLEQKAIQQKAADEMIVKKAAVLVKTKANQDKKLKEVIGDIPELDEIEERIIKKPKRKKIIYREESDSEEEVIIKPAKKVPTKESIYIDPKHFRINFC